MNIQKANVVELAPIAAVTATGNGTGVDITAYEGYGQIVLVSAAGTGTSPTLDVKVQESSDDSTYTDITGLAFTQVTDAADITQMLQIDISGTKKYVRVVDTAGGTTPSFDRSVVLIAGRKSGRNASQAV